MTLFILALSMILLIGATGVFVRALSQVVTEMRQTLLDGKERISRIKDFFDAVRKEEEFFHNNLDQLREIAIFWPRAVIMPREFTLLVRYVRTLSSMTTFITTFFRWSRGKS